MILSIFRESLCFLNNPVKVTAGGIYTQEHFRVSRYAPIGADRRRSTCGRRAHRRSSGIDHR